MTAAPESPNDGEREEALRALAHLAPLERQVLLLNSAHGLAHHEIAERLGISRRRVERLLVRALVKFDRALDNRPRPWWRFWS